MTDEIERALARFKVRDEKRQQDAKVAEDKAADEAAAKRARLQKWTVEAKAVLDAQCIELSNRLTKDDAPLKVTVGGSNLAEEPPPAHVYYFSATQNRGLALLTFTLDGDSVSAAFHYRIGGESQRASAPPELGQTVPLDYVVANKAWSAEIFRVACVHVLDHM